MGEEINDKTMTKKERQEYEAAVQRYEDARKFFLKKAKTKIEKAAAFSRLTEAVKDILKPEGIK